MVFKPLLLPLLLLISSLPLISSRSELHDYPPLADGLAWEFYDGTCHDLESIVRAHLRSVFDSDVGLAAGLLRVFFHDCFVQGCDGSVLLTGSDSEQASSPNQTLRPKALQVIDDLRGLVEDACGSVVSCADITALAAREAVFLTGGPYFKMPLGRRDSVTFAPAADTIASIPSPRSNITALLKTFKDKKLSLMDLVALSGAHTIGVGHCAAFADRLYPAQDSYMDPSYAKRLYATCPTATAANATGLDFRSPDAFDNMYFVNLVNGEGLLASDQGLFGDERTKKVVKKFAGEQKRFFRKFVRAVIKMSQLDVLTGSKGEIRRDCTVPNSAAAGLSAM
ncbi:peroxidase 12 [Musa acuminata AAA Group]|uniref:peroxidase 12 n=1 Tax=Musa acuminata AAA Group TaxID=214697 RepID=UPI0031D479E0